MVMNGYAMYEGEFNDGVREGVGRMFFFNGTVYEGCWSQNVCVTPQVP